jgi:hypothetical protein
MPSHCDCACTTYEYRIRDLKLTQGEYQKIVDTLGEVDLEEKRRKKQEIKRGLEEQIKQIERKIKQLEVKR